LFVENLFPPPALDRGEAWVSRRRCQAFVENLFAPTALGFIRGALSRKFRLMFLGKAECAGLISPASTKRVRTAVPHWVKPAYMGMEQGENSLRL